MNNIYVDELPKNCGECPMTYREHSFARLRCQFNGECIEYECKLADCPLKPLTDRLAEERMRIVKEIRDSAGNYFELPYCDECGNANGNDVVLTGNDLTEILDKIENE